LLKKEFKAKENYKRSLDLAHSMHPIPIGKAWYKVEPHTTFTPPMLLKSLPQHHSQT